MHSVPPRFIVRSIYPNKSRPLYMAITAKLYIPTSNALLLYRYQYQVVRIYIYVVLVTLSDSGLHATMYEHRYHGTV